MAFRLTVIIRAARSELIVACLTFALARSRAAATVVDSTSAVSILAIRFRMVSRAAVSGAAMDVRLSGHHLSIRSGFFSSSRTLVGKRGARRIPRRRVLSARGLWSKYEATTVTLMHAHYYLMGADRSRFWGDAALKEASKLICVAGSDLRAELAAARTEVNEEMAG